MKTRTRKNCKDKVFVTIGLTAEQWAYLVPDESTSGISVNDHIKELINKAIDEAK